MAQQEPVAWRYQPTMTEQEDKERLAAEILLAMRRLVLRLAAFGAGRHPQADTVLERVRQEVRGGPTLAALESLLGEMADAVARLDEVVAPMADGRQVLGTALAGMEFDVALDDTIAAFKTSLQDVRVDMLSKARELAGLVNRHGQLLKDDIDILQGVLHSVGSRLEDSRRYIDVEVGEHESQARHGMSWDTQVREEMRLLGERSRQAVDLPSLREQVALRVESIDRHVRTHRASEDQRLAGYLERADQMRRRVQDLEAETALLKDSLKRERELSSIDTLTGLPNRSTYETHIDALWRACTVAGRALSITLFDIDHFKQVNDSLGHVAGDTVLRIVGESLQKLVGERVFVCRYGGEEFVLVMDGMVLEDALRFSEGVRVAIEQLGFRAEGHAVPVTLSGGVAAFRAEDTPGDVLQRADRLLYAAKAAGRNCLRA